MALSAREVEEVAASPVDGDCLMGFEYGMPDAPVQALVAFHSDNARADMNPIVLSPYLMDLRRVFGPIWSSRTLVYSEGRWQEVIV